MPIWNILAPWNMQYMEEMKNICRNNRDNAEKFITEAMNLLENPNTIIPSKRFYVDFDEEVLKDLKILLGPKVTESRRNCKINSKRVLSNSPDK